MDIRNPEYILEIARQASITRAAEKLYVTQSTLSQYLLKAEAEVGTPLFLREKGGLVPTDAGRLYLRAAEDILRIRRSAEEGISALRNEGIIRLGCSSWGLELVARSLPDFKARFPAVTLKLFENTYAPMKKQLNAGMLDMAIMAIVPEDDLPSQGYTHMCYEELVLILPACHPFYQTDPGRTHVRREVLAGELRSASFIFGDDGSTIRRMEDQLFSTLMHRPNVVCEMSHHDLTQKMVAAGVGAAIVPEVDLLGLPNVRVFRFDPPLCREDILVFRRDVKKTPAMEYLAEVLISNRTWSDGPSASVSRRP